jgi:hypothetical protein
MNKGKWTFGWLLLMLGLSYGWSANAGSHVHDFGLKPQLAVCDGKGTYRYEATWTPIADSLTYSIGTGNQCRLNNSVVCGTRGIGCQVTCSKDHCSAIMTGCLIGRGATWVRVVDMRGGFYQQALTPPPSYCR